MRGKRKIAAFLTAVMLLSTAGTAYAESNVLGRPRAASSENMIEVTLDAKGGKFNDAETATGSTPDDASKSTANNAGKKVIELEVEGTDENGYEYAVWPNSPEYDFDVTHVSENGRDLEFGGWYYSLDDISTKVVAGETRLYHKTTLKAKWFMGEGAVVGEAAEEFEVKVKGLDTYDPEAALNVRYLSEEEKKTDIQLQNAVSGKGVKLDTKNAVQLDFDVPGGVKEEVEITMKIPTELDAEKKIYVLHFEKSGNVKDVDNTVNKASGEISFKLGSFSPVILVNGEAIDSDDMVSLTVKNVAGGYLYVTEGERRYNPEKIFPIGEEVKIPAGTEVWIQSKTYWNDDVPEDKRPALDYVTAITKSGNITMTDDDLTDAFTVTEDTVLEAKFTLVDRPTGGKGDMTFSIILDPDTLEKEGVYSGKVIKVYNDETGEEVPLSEVKLSLKSAEYQEQEYTYDDTTKILTSKEVLSYGYNNMDFDVVYKGKTYDGYGGVKVGYFINGLITMVKNRYEFWAEAQYGGGTTVKDALAALADEKQDPFMYNYQFKGWADRKGKLYDVNDMTKLDDGITVFAVFEKDGKVYSVNPIGSEEGNNEKPSKPSTGGSGSSVSSVGTHGVDRSAYDNTASTHTLTGTWEQTAQGWKFKTSSGSYASARWALINNEWYFFNDQGIMLTGWHFLNDRWFYLNQDPITGEGRMLTGWQQINGKWYYLNPVSDGNKGAMAADAWIGDWYVDASGAWIPEKAK